MSTKRGYRWAVVSFLFFMSLFLLDQLSFFERLDVSWLDLLQREKASRNPQHTVIVALDFASTQALGWPLSKDLYAAAINAVHKAGAKRIGVDIFFTDRTQTDDAVSVEVLEQERLLGIVAASTETVLASWVETLPDDGKNTAELPSLHKSSLLPAKDGVVAHEKLTFVHPLLKGIREHKPLVAHAHIEISPFDGVARLITPCIELHDGFVPDLASATTKIYPSPPGCLDPVLVPLTGAFADFPTISFVDLLSAADENPEKLKKLFNGKIVLFGATDPTLKDIGSTSAASSEPLVSIHANRIEALLSGRSIRLFDFWVYAVISALLTFLFMLLSRTIRHSIALVFIAIIAPFLVSWGLFMAADVYIAPLFIVLPLLLTLAGVIGYDSWHYFLFNNVLSAAFGAYVSPDVLKWLKKTGAEVLMPDRAARRNITILFSDIAGYTSLSNALSAQDVMDSLQLYLDKMLRITMQHGGYIDKINGDGLMILFGAPGENVNHSKQAFECGLAMQKAVAHMQEEWMKITDNPLVIRIGIATGEVFVGNIGGMTHIEYTAIGREVNLAARLESASQKGGVLISSATFDALTEKPDGEWREVKLKGYDEPVKAWQVFL